MDTDAYGLTVQHNHAIQVHVVPMKCEKYSSKSEISDKNSKISDIFYEIALFCAIFRQCWWIQMYMELLCRLCT